MSVTTVSPQQLADLCKTGNKIDFLDVRTPSFPSLPWNKVRRG